MLNQLTDLMTKAAPELTNKAIAGAVALIGGLSLVPPILFFSCHALTRSCREQKDNEQLQHECDGTKLKKK
jgi:hypothetical protein